MGQLFYPPELYTIDDVLPHIADKPEIIVSRQEAFTYIDYAYATPTTFDNPYAVECRGLKFDPAGRLIGRSYHKFKNANENDEYQMHAIDFSEDHVLLEKLDGSMVHTVVLGQTLRLMTRKGLSDVALRAENYLARAHQKYAGLFALSLYPTDEWTFIFEYVAPTNQIVIFYEEESLILTGIRHIETGSYVPYPALCDIAADCGVPVVQPYSADLDMEAVRADEDREGLVIRFIGGGMVKIKADLYCAKHGAVDKVTTAPGVIRLVYANALDDILPSLAGDFKDRVLTYADAFIEGCRIAGEKIAAETVALDHLDDKAFALEIAALPHKGLLFSFRKFRNADKIVRNLVEKTNFKPKRFADLCHTMNLPYEDDLGRW